MIEVKAKLRFAHISSKKARLVVRGLRGRSPLAVIEELKLMPQKAASLVALLLNSAVSNARNNFNLDPNKLIIEKIAVDSGPTYKRYWLRSRGQVDLLRKRTSHFIVTLKEQEEKKAESEGPGAESRKRKAEGRAEKQLAARFKKPQAQKQANKQQNVPSTKAPAH